MTERKKADLFNSREETREKARIVNQYIEDTGCSQIEAARKFGISKGVVSKYVKLGKMAVLKTMKRVPVVLEDVNPEELCWKLRKEGMPPRKIAEIVKVCENDVKRMIDNVGRAQLAESSLVKVALAAERLGDMRLQVSSLLKPQRCPGCDELLAYPTPTQVLAVVNSLLAIEDREAKHFGTDAAPKAPLPSAMNEEQIIDGVINIVASNEEIMVRVMKEVRKNESMAVRARVVLDGR